MHSFFQLSINPRRVLLWGMAGALCVLLIAGLTMLLLAMPRSLPRETRVGIAPGNILFSIRGENVQRTLQESLTFLYGEQSDERRIADAVLQSLVRETFGESVMVEQMLSAFGDAPFSFTVQARGEFPSWVVVLGTERAVGETQSQFLHDAFESRFPSIVVQKRTVPSGRDVSEVRVGRSPVDRTEEQWGEYRVVQSTAKESDEMFLTATARGRVLLGNDRKLFSLVFTGEDLRRGEKALSVSRDGFRLFSALFPDSAPIHYARGMLRKDSELSLSSFRCILFE